MRKLRALLAVGCLLYLGSQATRAQSKRGVTPEDYLSFKFAGDPHISPDGRGVAFVLTVIDQKKNRRESSIWIVPADGSAAPRRFSAEGLARTRRDGVRMGRRWHFFRRELRIFRPGRLPNLRFFCCPLPAGARRLRLQD
jgi:hypothetical protein